MHRYLIEYWSTAENKTTRMIYKSFYNQDIAYTMIEKSLKQLAVSYINLNVIDIDTLPELDEFDRGY
jgi:hypothetical protein